MYQYIKFLSLVAIATISLSSCSNETIYPKEKVDAYFDSVISNGLTRDEVEATFGKPYKSANDNTKGLVYVQYNLLDAKNPVYVEGIKYDKWEVWSSFHKRFIAYKDNVIVNHSDSYDMLRGIKHKATKAPSVTHVSEDSSITIKTDKSVSCSNTGSGMKCVTY